MIDYAAITAEANKAVLELLAVAKLRAGDLFVVGCSSSEVVGGHIGKDCNAEAAQAVFDGIYPELKSRGIFLAAQCCEHLNRSLILEREALEKYGYEEVNVRPWLHGGGAFATCVFEHLQDPVATSQIKAAAGMDIGDVLIGMHLRRVAVPVRLETKTVGAAHLCCARTRPPYAGGERARYREELE